MNELDETRSIWTTRASLGTVQTLRHRGQVVSYRMPTEIDGQVTLRFQGHGRTVDGKAGDLLLRVQVDRGQNVELALWLPASQAISGGQQALRVGKHRLQISVPAGSQDGKTVRLAGFGRKTPWRWGLPLAGRERGDLTVKIRVFPENIAPACGAVDGMSNEDMASESWIYRRIDFIHERIPRLLASRRRVTAAEVASTFNEGGWRALARLLVALLELDGSQFRFTASASLAVPGQFERSADRSFRLNNRAFNITIQEKFLDEPFAVTAILTHELCHAVFLQELGDGKAHVSQPGPELLELERTVDLLVFMFQLGEFQMRVARDSRITLGYFNQALFERMYVLLERKCPSKGPVAPA